MRISGHTCGRVEAGVVCDKPAVEFAEIETDQGRVRLWLCADHSDNKEWLEGLDCRGLPREDLSDKDGFQYD